MFDKQAEIIESRLAEKWLNTTPVVWDGTTAPTIPGEPWIRLTTTWIDSLLVAGESQKGIYRETGLSTIEVYVPRSQGSAKAYELADQLVGIYRTFSANSLFAMSPYVQRIGNEEEWYHLNVYVPFKYDRVFP